MFSIHTWIGTIRVDFSPDPFRIRRIWLPGTHHPEPYDPAAQSDSPQLTKYPPCPEMQILEKIIRDYFEFGKPLETPWQWLCPDHLRPLQKQVLQITALIPYGRVRTYRDIAVDLGKPAAARFVGNALAANPWPLLVPCHRVIRSSGAPGGFGGGTDMKASLIRHETGAKHPVLVHRS